MYAVLPSIESQPEVVEAYRDTPPAPVGAYRSDGVERITADEVRSLVEATFAASSAPSFTADGRPA